jgi:hypothetical protein
MFPQAFFTTCENFKAIIKFHYGAIHSLCNKLKFEIGKGDHK